MRYKGIMLNNKNKLSLSKKFTSASSFKKKSIVLFIFACMFVNGFVSNINNVDKYSFTLLLVNISKNASMQILNKYGGSMIDVSNKICIDILNMILPVEAQNPAENQKKEDKKDNNTANDYAVLNNALQHNGKRVISAGGESAEGIYVHSFLEDYVFNVYNEHKVLCGGNLLLLLLFIVFIISIRRRKGKSAAYDNTNNMIWKRRVSA